ncbi:hypothetical protein Sm713_13590 [Streptomyces sp. TS71-3]|nr:hypothetical protein Sm713_13590 [Streptomyces sp. TS71-3]
MTREAGPFVEGDAAPVPDGGGALCEVLGQDAPLGAVAGVAWGRAVGVADEDDQRFAQHRAGYGVRVLLQAVQGPGLDGTLAECDVAQPSERTWCDQGGVASGRGDEDDRAALCVERAHQGGRGPYVVDTAARAAQVYFHGKQGEEGHGRGGGDEDPGMGGRQHGGERWDQCPEEKAEADVGVQDVAVDVERLPGQGDGEEEYLRDGAQRTGHSGQAQLPRHGRSRGRGCVRVAQEAAAEGREDGGPDGAHRAGSGGLDPGELPGLALAGHDQGQGAEGCGARGEEPPSPEGPACPGEAERGSVGGQREQ